MPFTLAKLRLGFDDFFARRAAAFAETNIGKNYIPLFQKQHKAILALPPALLDDRSVKEQLAEANRTHDGFGRAIYYTFESCLHRPDLSDAERQEAEVLRSEVVPALASLSQQAHLEADAAVRGLARLEQLKPRLERYAVAGGKTVYDLAAAFFGTGPGRRELLSQRVDHQPTEEEKALRAQSAALLSTTIGMLSRAKAGLLDELLANPALDRDLPRKAFGFFDELEHQGDAPSSPKDPPGASGGAAQA